MSISGTQKVGESSVQLILKDCVVFENWHGLQGGDGKSFNKYNNVTQAVGAVLGLGQRDNELLQGLAGGWGDALHARDADGLRRNVDSASDVFADGRKGRCGSCRRRSMDGGKTWTTEYDLVYVKKQ